MNQNSQCELQDAKDRKNIAIDLSLHRKLKSTAAVRGVSLKVLAEKFIRTGLQSADGPIPNAHNNALSGKSLPVD